ncbi:MAG: prepilin-type N-terminal cleavage/methylation domain-containing protein [Bacteroidales bacterium]|nr:prepilin-type N-terminal cleavage/methylation domain-containing protein [Clostridium sp.]MCM1202608.1 prepilin-type N-terminal cleavage/methylation domain-containing protein [Bacteroidales bacterium]
MANQKNQNKGFTLIELLISLALLSIIMVMVVQFMGTTSRANMRTKENLKVQTEAKEVMTNLMDGLITANYVQIRSKDGRVYSMAKNSGVRTESLTALAGSVSVPINSSMTIVPDNFGNYNLPVDADGNYTSPERKVIVDLDTFELPGEVNGKKYPLDGDLHKSAIADARSFRILKQDVGGTDTYLYIEPLYIYAECNALDASGNPTKVDAVMYSFKDNSDGSVSVYLGRKTYDRNDTSRWYNALITTPSSGDDGLLTKRLVDFYLSADVEGNALLIDALFEINGYKYNAADTIKFRNSSVLTVRPQNLYKKINISGSGGATP